MRLDPDSPATTLDDFLADRQADAVTWVFGARVQAMEHFKNFPCTFRCDSNSVITHVEPPVLILVFRLHGNFRRFLAAELNGVPDQILEDLSQLSAVSLNLWKLGITDRRAALLDRPDRVCKTSSITALQSIFASLDSARPTREKASRS